MKKLPLILTLILLGALALSACQPAAPPSGGGVPAPTQAASSSGDDAPAPTTESGASGEGESGSSESLELSDVSEGLDALDSYKATFNMSFEGADDQGEAQSSSWAWTEEYSKNPPAKRSAFTGTDASNPEAAGGFEMIEVDGKTYSIFGDICASSAADEAPSTTTSFSPSDIIGDIRSSQFLGVENINGVSARHFAVDMSGALALSGLTQATAEAWIADPGNFVVKYVFEATGKNVFFGTSDAEGTLHWDYEVTSVNQPVNIVPPENCGGAPEDIPLMPDATDTSAFGETTTYTSASTFEDVVAFYNEQMPANGWTAEESGGFSMEDFASLSFTKEGRTASITITFDTSSNESTVLITVSEE
ncbi:MAG TPA: hypothetical protein VJG32_18555 [Anaerolineae bacterium]|nr:hypothetical protein [Anaerolineae bacterium]